MMDAGFRDITGFSKGMLTVEEYLESVRRTTEFGCVAPNPMGYPALFWLGGMLHAAGAVNSETGEVEGEYWSSVRKEWMPVTPFDGRKKERITPFSLKDAARLDGFEFNPAWVGYIAAE